MKRVLESISGEGLEFFLCFKINLRIACRVDSVGLGFEVRNVSNSLVVMVMKLRVNVGENVWMKLLRLDFCGC